MNKLVAIIILGVFGISFLTMGLYLAIKDRKNSINGGMLLLVMAVPVLLVSLCLLALVGVPL